MELPKGVTNKEAYLEYLEALEEIDKHPDRFKKTSTGVTLDFKATTYIIKKQVSKLPPEEQEELLSHSPKFRSMITKAATIKRKAFGTLSGDLAKNTDGLGPLVKRQMELLELFGRFFSVSEVHRIVTLDWGYDISVQSLHNFRGKHITKITELQKEYEESFSDVRLGKRRSRLDELSWLYSKTKEKYIANEAREDAKLLQSLLESVKKEVDGDLVINGKIKLDIEATINIQVQEDMMKNFNISAYIISRLAGRMNINPIFLISRLARSQYAKFTGFGGATKSQMDSDEIYSIANLTYDFDQIEHQNQIQVERDNNLKQLPGMTIEVKEKVLSIKERMLEKAKRYQGEVSKLSTEIPQ